LNSKNHLTEFSKKEVIKGVKVIAFVGPAGTGKSQRAQLVAKDLGADYIIDDGLVIRKGQIVCGRSAKTEKNQIKAIRRALFQFEDHREAVRSFLKKAQPCTVMIISTSVGMVEQITNNLGLNTPEKIIRIEEVASKEEIMNARRERAIKGQHVIPVSHVQVRRNFAGKLVGRLKVFLSDKQEHEGEKTIVRPPFKFYGSLHIEPTAIEQIGKFVVAGTRGVSKIIDVDVKSLDEKVALSVQIRAICGELQFFELGKLIQKRLNSAISTFTGLEVARIDLIIQEVDFR